MLRLTNSNMSKPKVTRSMSKRAAAEGNGLAERKKTHTVDHVETVLVGVKRPKRSKSINKENDKNSKRDLFHKGKVELRFVPASDVILDKTNWLQTAKIENSSNCGSSSRIDCQFQFIGERLRCAVCQLQMLS